jgi:hypothetical protein
MPSAVTCVTRGFDSFSMSGWYPAMTDRTDAKLLEVLRRELGGTVSSISLAECILPEAQAPQPDHNVHDGAYYRGWRTSSAGAARVSRVTLGVLWASQSPLRSNGNQPNDLKGEIAKAYVESPMRH